MVFSSKETIIYLYTHMNVSKNNIINLSDDINGLLFSLSNRCLRRALGSDKFHEVCRYG